MSEPVDEIDAVDVVAILASARGGRGRLKRAGAWLDAQPDSVREALIVDAGKRGIRLEDDATSLPGKRLLRACLARSEAAQERRNPIPRDEPFTCTHCAADVPAHGRTARDHCPYCLRSLHVDVVPGDRAADCGGLLDPVACEALGGRLTLRFICRRCGASRTNRAITDSGVPDDPRVLARVSAGESV